MPLARGWVLGFARGRTGEAYRALRLSQAARQGAEYDAVIFLPPFEAARFHGRDVPRPKKPNFLGNAQHLCDEFDAEVRENGQ